MNKKIFLYLAIFGSISVPQAINLMAQFDANGVDSTQAMAGLKKALQNATSEGK